MKKIIVYILRDKTTGLYFNRARFKATPAVYDEGTAKGFFTKYNGKPIVGPGSEVPFFNGFFPKCDLEIIPCKLVKIK